MKDKFDSVIFDMDGVLVDVRKSIDPSDVETVKYLLEKNYGIKKKVSIVDVLAMRKISGFNSDWDLSYALVDLLRRNIKRKDFATNVIKLNDNIRKSDAYFATRSVWETFYWGNKMYKTLRQKPAPFINKKPLFGTETLLIKKRTLINLARKYPLGIATGRIDFEVAQIYKKFQLDKYFPDEFIVTFDDTTVQKPHPAPLLEAKKRMQVKNPVYIGDTINDIVAAKRAKMPSIYVGTEKLGDYQVKDVNEILEILL